MSQLDTYTVATDGACRRNPGPTGWAWVGEDGQWAAGSVLEGTNNVGELLVRQARRAADLEDVTFVHVRGHRGHRLNGWADECAVRALHHAADDRKLIWSSRQGRPILDVSEDGPRMAKEKARALRPR
ncbi:ribonuclease HI [Microbacterium sp. ZW T5_56]|uniref:ribonuclease HI n=1 Tax=Microbacterium sp. ZW T5_56 TaxID=3378081 RepID=UPI0038549BC0